jgi:transcriptional regulator with XRE-family HTH domain
MSSAPRTLRSSFRAPSQAVEADPVAERIRRKRIGKGLSLRGLADRASERIRAARSRGLHTRSATVSTGYLSLIENGRKVPDPPVALAIAEALDDDPSIYSAWIAVRKRSDVPTALAAARLLGTLADRPSAPDTRARHAVAARLRIPVIAEGDDPGEGLRPACAVIGWLRIDLERLSETDRARLTHPVAWPVHADALHVADTFWEGAVALLIRDFLPLRTDEAYAVRHRGRVVIRKILWNGTQLLLLPPPGASDFTVVDAAGEDRLRERVLGLVRPIASDEELAS